MKSIFKTCYGVTVEFLTMANLVELREQFEELERECDLLDEEAEKATAEAEDARQEAMDAAVRFNHYKREFEETEHKAQAAERRAEEAQRKAEEAEENRAQIYSEWAEAAALEEYDASPMEAEDSDQYAASDGDNAAQLLEEDDAPPMEEKGAASDGDGSDDNCLALTLVNHVRQMELMAAYFKEQAKVSGLPDMAVPVNDVDIEYKETDITLDAEKMWDNFRVREDRYGLHLAPGRDQPTKSLGDVSHEEMMRWYKEVVIANIRIAHKQANHGGHDNASLFNKYSDFWREIWARWQDLQKKNAKKNAANEHKAAKKQIEELLENATPGAHLESQRDLLQLLSKKQLLQILWKEERFFGMKFTRMKVGDVLNLVLNPDVFEEKKPARKKQPAEKAIKVKKPAGKATKVKKPAGKATKVKKPKGKLTEVKKSVQQCPLCHFILWQGDEWEDHWNEHWTEMGVKRPPSLDDFL